VIIKEILESNKFLDSLANNLHCNPIAIQFVSNFGKEISVEGKKERTLTMSDQNPIGNP
jgi:hypothetical protein